MTYLHDMVSNMSRMLCNPSAVCLILTEASTGDKSGSKNRSLRKECVIQFSATATGMPCSPSAASEVTRNVVTSFLRLPILIALFCRVESMLGLREGRACCTGDFEVRGSCG
ncbi:hypothetical protein F3Y22_tig00111799pilonHSYRG00011 [Hibiscus syriacus]|uniref:Uncharacterized protein n=1 Tax=Hibiscus syriacus TaxID=106335 RepID=A0A6A2XTN4_HIBSY|nr:hypothetical protein F3Y22_tig00111799pilonHSYRG00011 [Hibiscus syriacus]